VFIALLSGFIFGTILSLFGQSFLWEIEISPKGWFHEISLFFFGGKIRAVLPGFFEEEGLKFLMDLQGKGESVSFEKGKWSWRRVLELIFIGPWGYSWRHLKGFLNTWEDFLSRVSCRECRLDLKLGTGDAAETAFLYGLVWNILAFMYENSLKHVREFLLRRCGVYSPDSTARGWKADSDAY